MTLPTNSVSIQGIGTTSPAVESGKTSVVRLSDELKEFMAALSPAGATAYDTGDVTITAASPVTPYGVAGVRSRRIGKDVKLRGNIIMSAATSLSGPGGVVVGTTPHPPAAQQIQRITSQIGDLEVIISAVGVVTVRQLQGTMSFASGNYISFDGVCYNAA